MEPLSPDFPAKAEALLRERFGFPAFLPGQQEAIGTILAGEDCLIVMPTGAGKSLCYQLPALLLDGLTVVVSPLIALMKDQVDALTARGIPATAINSTLSESEMNERIAGMQRGAYRLVYIAPERFRSDRFARALAPLSIALFAIDEAHCISQWGHDFRTDYLRLRDALAELGRPPVAALTATATPDVRDDIVAQLALGRDGRAPPRVFVHGFARPNLVLSVRRVSGRDEKLRHLAAAARRLGAGIVYCATRRAVEETAARLEAEGLPAIAYHGGMSDPDRHAAQQSFMDAKSPLVVATNAFGMGIDRPDLRFVIHHDIPGSVESYYQEAGRAGRDGEIAHCDLYFNYADVRTQEFFLDGANPGPDLIRAVYAALAAACAKGPAPASADALRARLSTGGRVNGMAVETAIGVLDRAGVVRRTWRAEGREALCELASPGLAPDALPVDFDALAEKRQRDERRLSAMVRYASTPRCRHRYILDYFGDPEAGSACAACDNCGAASHAPVRLPDEAETVILQKALSCVARMQGRYGRGRIVQVLVGGTAREIVEAGLDRLSTYGLLAAEGTAYVWALLDALVAARCIETRGENYPTLALTPLGEDVLHRRRAIPLSLPERRPPKAPRRKADGAGSKADDEAPYDAAVFEALRAWRRAKAAELGVPAYVVYPDRTLRELARTLPRDDAALRAVRGIGPAKAAQFGAETLALLRAPPPPTP